MDMGRVSGKIIESVAKFLGSLPEDSRAKCMLCTRTLTHIVKQAEAYTGAGTTTVTDALAELHNKTAAPQDRITGNALRQRVLQHEGSKKRPIGSNGTNKTEEFALLIPKITNDIGSMIVGEHLEQWVIDNNRDVYKTCFTCTQQEKGPIRDFISKKKKGCYCDKWDLGYKFCFNCALLSEDGCPDIFWEFKDLIKDTDSLLEKIWICRNWQPSKKLFPIASDCLELEISSDA
jgi:hypothetical protein